ncbi:MAG: ATP-binding protein [Methylocella sp.]
MSVRDHGPVIPASFRRRVSEKFAQADASDARQKSGTGLGLSIVKEIVQQVDREVGFSDAPGGGTIFFVELPRPDRIDGGDAGALILLCGFDEARLLGQISKAIGRNGNRPVRVLHLDDDPDVLAVVAQTFAGDADVVSATTLENARQALAAGDFGLAILDLVLDGSSGTDLLPDLHDSAGLPIPVIVYSTRAANLECCGLLQAAMIKSPGSIDGLVAILETA